MPRRGGRHPAPWPCRHALLPRGRGGPAGRRGRRRRREPPPARCPCRALLFWPRRRWAVAEGVAAGCAWPGSPLPWRGGRTRRRPAGGDKAVPAAAQQTSCVDLGEGGSPAARTRRPSPVGPPLPRAVRLDGRCAAAAARRDEGRRLGRRGPGRRRGGRPRHPPGEWGGASTAPRANRVHLQDAWWQLGGGGAGGGSGVPCPPLTTRTAPLPAPAVPIVHRRGNGDGGGGPSGGGRLQLAPPWVTVPYRRRTRGRGGR